MKKILVADDESSLRELFSEFLGKSLGYSIETAGDVNEAIRKIRDDDSLDLVICDFDFKMPNLTGKDVYEYIQQNKSGLPFILFSTYTPSQCGLPESVDYITKPFKLTDLKEKIKGYIGKP